MKSLYRISLVACLLLAFSMEQVPVAQQSKDAGQAKPESSPPPPGPGGTSTPNADPFPSTYQPYPRRTTLIRNATIMTAAGPTLQNASVLLRDGKIAAVGTNLSPPADAVVIDGTGKYVTPGIIDVHSHIGDYPAPGVDANSDGNEATNPVTANVWAEHSVWPQDPQFPRALAGGVTTMQILPGSANLIGGHTRDSPERFRAAAAR